MPQVMAQAGYSDTHFITVVNSLLYWHRITEHASLIFAQLTHGVEREVSGSNTVLETLMISCGEHVRRYSQLVQIS